MLSLAHFLIIPCAFLTIYQSTVLVSSNLLSGLKWYIWVCGSSQLSNIRVYGSDPAI